MTPFLLLLCIVAIFSFLTTSIFMFITKSDSLKNAFFALGIMLGVLLTIISSASIPSTLVTETALSWMGLVPAALALMITAAKGKVTAVSKVLAVITGALGVVGVLLQIKALAFPAVLILGVIVLFSFLVCAFFMFKSKDKHIQSVIFVLSSFLGIIVTAICAVSITDGMTPQLILTWLGLIPMILGIIITALKRKPVFISKVLVLLTTVYGVVGYFIL